ncbi:MAG: hypothetical protein MUD14_05280 [Hydrococcus sp. Prado102]|jgi:hypothetical protein|nr:hypothetical protein [Hydrococcus sp. Prado102]
MIFSNFKLQKYVSAIAIAIGLSGTIIAIPKSAQTKHLLSIQPIAIALLAQEFPCISLTKIGMSLARKTSSKR